MQLLERHFTLNYYKLHYFYLFYLMSNLSNHQDYQHEELSTPVKVSFLLYQKLINNNKNTDNINNHAKAPNRAQLFAK